MGKVVGCPECMILEFRDGDSRLAYFSRPEPDCELKPVHIRSASSRTEEREMVLELSRTGKDYVSECFGEDAEKDARAVLVTVNGVTVGRSMFHEHFEVLSIVGGDSFALLEALFPGE